MVNKLEGQILDPTEQQTIGRIPFVSPMLTWATTGGVKIGQLGRWYGIEGSGKSLTNWGLIKAAMNYPEVISDQYERQIKILESRGGKALAIKKRKQDMKKLVDKFPDGMTVALFDAEGRASLDLAESMGIRTKDIEISYEDIIEHVCDGMAAAMEWANLVILDSATVCESVQDAGLDPGEYSQASGPRAWSRLKRVQRAMKKNPGENTLIIVDQVRAQLGQKMFKGQAPPPAPPGVRIFRHNASLAINFATGPKLYLDKNADLTDDYDKASNDYPALGTDGKEPHGLELRCKIDKNSNGRPFRNARMRFRFDVPNRDGEIVQRAGFDEAFELVESAIEFNMLEKSGSFYYRLDENGKRVKGKTAGKAMHGEAQVRSKIEEDEEWAEQIRQRLVAMT